MQGSSDPNVELMDAAAFVSHLIPADSVCAFLAGLRHRSFPDETSADLIPSRRGCPLQPADVIALAQGCSRWRVVGREAVQSLATDLR
jgi:hypothetical protein